METISRQPSSEAEATSHWDPATSAVSVRHDSIPDTLVAVESFSANECKDRTVEQFIALGFDLLQAPDAFSWSYLRDFMGHIDGCSSLELTESLSTAGRCLIDCITPAKIDGGGLATTHRTAPASAAPDSDAAAYAKEVHERTAANVRQLLKWFQCKARQNSRTILFLTDMTPAYAAALATQVDAAYASLLREYIQSHLADETEFIAVMPRGYNLYSESNMPSHIAAHIGFVYGFHLPYIALRRNVTGADPRGVRESIPMIKPLQSNLDHSKQDDLICHEGQTSFLIAGRSATEWFAICNIDTWFGSEQDIDAYLRQDQDGPSGGAKCGTKYFLHPREYFLLVLSQRFRQISSEWGNVFTHLTKRLDTYETHYLNTIDSITSEFYHEESMSRTRSYLKAASMLRQYCDTVSLVTQRLKSYLEEHGPMLFDSDDSLEHDPSIYRITIDWELAHLNRWRNRLYSKMERFEVMCEGLSSALQLRESRRTTKQSSDIGVLTWVTVLYLPFNTAAAVLGMSGQLPGSTAWIGWSVASLVLVVITIISTFGRNLRFSIRLRISRKEHHAERDDIERLTQQPNRKSRLPLLK